jgi:hypothetical protein
VARIKNDSFKQQRWGVDANLYNRDYTNGKRIALIFTPSDLETFNKNAPWWDKEALKQAVQLDSKIKNRVFYLFDFNPAVEFRMPFAKNDLSVYYFSDRYVIKDRNASDYAIDWRNGTLTMWSDNSIQGPNVAAKKGKYNFTINYEYINFNKPATLFIKNGQQQTPFTIELDNQTLTQSFDIRLKDDASNLRFIVQNREGSRILLKNMSVTRVK